MSVDTNLATLRDWIGDPEDYSDEDRGAAERACDACDGVEAELSRLREQITELLQQESFMERKMAAQREDIERLAARVEAAEARCAQLEQALADVKDARRGIISACIAVKGKLDQPYPDDDRWTPWTRFVEPALHRLDEALAGPGSEQSSLTESGPAGLPDTPAASCEKCRHAAHEPGRCGANVGTGYQGPVLCRCGSGPGTPADSQPEEPTT